jgi:hypothetical protein
MFLRNRTREMVYYPILKKIIMWMNIQCKVSFKVKGDYRESIIYTARDLGERVRNI